MKDEIVIPCSSSTTTTTTYLLSYTTHTTCRNDKFVRSLIN